MMDTGRKVVRKRCDARVEDGLNEKETSKKERKGSSGGKQEKGL